MKKMIALLLLACLAIGLFAGCSNDNGGSSDAGQTDAGQTDDVQGTDDAQDGGTDSDGTADAANYRIAMISDTIGNEQFILQAYDKLAEMAETNGFTWTNVECTDTAAWEENARGTAADGYDLIVAVGWQAAGPFSELAEEYPDTSFAVIDTTASNDKVKSMSFSTVEGCYVLGAMAATAFPDEQLFGYVGNFQDQASYEYRYGFMQGVLSVKEDAEFMFNYANSYSDTSIVYELALQQQAAGCTFIFGGVSSSSNAGIYQAALELADKGTPIYTTGLSVDQTTEDNPYIIGGVTKNTDLCMELVVSEFLEGKFTGGSNVLGITEGAFGVVGVTTDTFNYRNTEMMTDEVIAAGMAARDAIASGQVQLTVPQEAN